MIENTHIQKAIKTARQSNVRRGKVAAMAFTKSGQLLAFANNRRVTGNKVWTEHAEEVLLRKLNKLRAFDRYGRLKIFVLRITSTGVSMAKPCVKCQSLLDRYDCEVFYTDWDARIFCL